MNALKTQDGREYRIANDGKRLEWKDPQSSQNDWLEYAVLPQNRICIKDLRESRMGAHCECLLDDGLWYSTSGRYFSLCDEEQSDDRREIKRAAKTHSSTGGDSLVGGVMSAVLDARQARQDLKVAEMAEERDREHQAREAARERRRQEDREKRHKYELENIIWGPSFKRESYMGKIRRLMYDYFYCEALRDYEVIDKLIETADISKRDPRFKAWLEKVNSHRPQKPVDTIVRLHPQTGQDPEEYAKEFVSIFTEEDLEARLQERRQKEALRREKARLRKQQEEEAREAVRKADEQDRIEGKGRWDISKVTKSKWVAFTLTLLLGWTGAQYFYIRKKWLGIMEIVLLVTSVGTFNLIGIGLIVIWWIISVFMMLFQSENKFKERFLPIEDN